MAKTTYFNSLHNQYLEASVKRGLIGFLALIAVLIIPFIIFTKRLKDNNIAIKCTAILGIIHIISHSFFLSQSFLAHNSGSMCYFFILILLYYLVKYKEKNI
ncbi:hypothetical protein AC571_11260 [Mannheimia haemolytica]|nr:hypothetical protein [Mannheimia haemolytica]KYL14035.1 hypothetical protein AC571_11260 [Mannheimia haemolytica]